MPSLSEAMEAAVAATAHLSLPDFKARGRAAIAAIEDPDQRQSMLEAFEDMYGADPIVTTPATPIMRQHVISAFKRLANHKAVQKSGINIRVSHERLIIRTSNIERASISFPLAFMDFCPKDNVLRLISGDSDLDTVSADHNVTLIMPLDGKGVRLEDTKAEYRGHDRHLMSFIDVAASGLLARRQAQPLAEWLTKNFATTFIKGFRGLQSLYINADPAMRVGCSYQSVIDADPVLKDIQSKGHGNMRLVSNAFNGELRQLVELGTIGMDIVLSRIDRQVRPTAAPISRPS